MKTILKILALLSLIAPAVIASDISCKVERGLNLIRSWKDGILASETRQLLTDCTNLYQQERYWQDCGIDWTQRVTQTWYSGNGAMPLTDGWILEWECDGDFVSNRLTSDMGLWSTFSSGGSQGAMTVQNGNGERTQIINVATLRAEWRTNSFVSSCDWPMTHPPDSLVSNQCRFGWTALFVGERADCPRDRKA
jgi:hypothetical protein